MAKHGAHNNSQNNTSNNHQQYRTAANGSHLGQSSPSLADPELVRVRKKRKKHGKAKKIVLIVLAVLVVLCVAVGAAVALYMSSIPIP